eukprot:COSAG01_NODE_3746_length_5742_cov_9.460393_4_plen_33_part_00
MEIHTHTHAQLSALLKQKMKKNEHHVMNTWLR